MRRGVGQFWTSPEAGQQQHEEDGQEQRRHIVNTLALEHDNERNVGEGLVRAALVRVVVHERRHFHELPLGVADESLRASSVVHGHDVHLASVVCPRPELEAAT